MGSVHLDSMLEGAIHICQVVVCFSHLAMHVPVPIYTGAHVHVCLLWLKHASNICGCTSMNVYT